MNEMEEKKNWEFIPVNRKEWENWTSNLESWRLTEGHGIQEDRLLKCDGDTKPDYEMKL